MPTLFDTTVNVVVRCPVWSKYQLICYLHFQLNKHSISDNFFLKNLLSSNQSKTIIDPAQNKIKKLKKNTYFYIIIIIIRNGVPSTNLDHMEMLKSIYIYIYEIIKAVEVHNLPIIGFCTQSFALCTLQRILFFCCCCFGFVKSIKRLFALRKIFSNNKPVRWPLLTIQLLRKTTT